MRTPKIMAKIKRALFLFDIHYQDYDKESWRLVLKFAKDFRPDILVLGGDQLDLSVISHWNENKPGITEGMRLKGDYDGFNDVILTPIEKLCAKGAKKKWIIGNHEKWIQDANDKNPKYKGLIEPEVILRLKERNWKITPFNGICKIGKLCVVHGLYTNQYHAAKTVNVFSKNVLYGHCHTPQVHFKPTPYDTRDYHSAQSVGCLCNQNPDYMRNRPNSWVKGFAVAYFLPDGSFSLYQIIIVDNKFIWNSRLYD